MELGRYFAIAKRWWWTLVVAVWVAGVSGYLVVDRVPETFETRSLVLVGPVNADVETIRAASSHVQLYAELVSAEPLLDGTIEELNLRMDREGLRGLVSASADTTTRLLTIRVQHGDPETAALIANTLASELAEYANSDLGRPDGRPTLLESAQPPLAPIAPQVNLITTMAAIAGLIGALLLVILVEYFSDTVRDEHDLRQQSNAPLLGTVDAWRGSGRHPLLVEALPDSRASNRYRLLTTKIAYADPDQPMRSLLIMGAQAADGAGEIAANLAVVLQKSGRRVILVDANEEEAEVSKRLGLVKRATTASGNDGGLLKHVIHDTTHGISVLPIGVVRQGEMIDSARARNVIASLLRATDLVVINVAPVHLSANTLVWARLVDATILTAFRDQTRRENVRNAVDSLRMVGVNLVGTVLMVRRNSLLVRTRTRRTSRVLDKRASPAAAPDLSRRAE